LFPRKTRTPALAERQIEPTAPVHRRFQQTTGAVRELIREAHPIAGSAERPLVYS
jgi:hypothetical protein